MSQIAGSIVLITGGGSGIGRRMALQFAARGARLVLWDIDKKRLDAVVKELKSGGTDAHGFVCDVSDRAKVYEVADRVKETVGDVDVVVNNAGIVSGKPFLEIPDEKIEATFKVNTLALFWVTKAFLPGMVARNAGHVVNVSSAAGLVGVARLSDYASSKFAAFGFDESLRVELKKTAPGVKTTVVCPFFIDTGMFEGAQSRFPFLLPFLKEEDVARAVVDAVERNRARVVMPPLVYLVPTLRLLPPLVFDAISSFLGVNEAMAHFKGRTPQKKKAAPRRTKKRSPKLEVI